MKKKKKEEDIRIIGAMFTFKYFFLVLRML